jgi:hypothetical protein
MDKRLARKRSFSATNPNQRANSSFASSVTASDQRSAQYQNSRYEKLLFTVGLYVDNWNCGLADEGKAACTDLLRREQKVPENSLFADEHFLTTCQKLRGRNEARVLRDISQLIVPSAETLATKGERHLNVLIDASNETWSCSMPLAGPRPQPDFSVGFRRDAFAEEQLQKLPPLVGISFDGDMLSPFMATSSMYFPFLACEVKCAAGSLEVADRQNLHSMSIAVRGVVELFRLVGREDEVHKQILAFSISHDDTRVRLYAHYPFIEENTTKYYRHLIDDYTLISDGGIYKWKAYQFTRNVYDIWMPQHLKRICSVVDQLPLDPDAQALPGPTQGSDKLVASATSAAPLEDSDCESDELGQVAIPSLSFAKPEPPKRMRGQTTDAGVTI